jgi:hypothetical protein
MPSVLGSIEALLIVKVTVTEQGRIFTKRNHGYVIL